MRESVSVVVATCGDPEWSVMARDAVDSALVQSHVPDRLVVQHYADLSVAQARNRAAEQVTTDWVIFLDADDALDRHYIDEMLRVRNGDVKRPSTLGVYPDGTEDEEPVMIPEAPMLERNTIVVGAMLSTKLFHAVGGFDDYPCLEDWTLWIKCWLAGARIVDAPRAVYRVGVREGSRNKNRSRHGEAAYNIRRRFLPLAKERGLV